MKVTVPINQVPGLMNYLANLVGPVRVLKNAATAALVRTQRHLLALNDSRANPLGGKRSNFYARFAKRNNLRIEADAKSASLLIGPADFGSESRGNPLEKHLIGGDIEAKAGKALAIPVNPAAYGVAPHSFTNLKLIILGPKKLAVLAAVGGGGGARLGKTNKIKRGKGAHSDLTKLEVFYLLLKKVTLKADRSVLPSEEDYQATVAQSLEELKQRLETGIA